ncbi:hypothetical protein EIP75_23875 [Aquabacterium soli]|uniref:ParB/Sulfiredoxin domain-containing protein n=1 Tax=Aquabacterium soli TaxID=2493092 RepID=A0A3R8TZN9_9BURK|nr:hypothetical protein [Aquabacterium soli]RRR98863.1 hypothetical protein EIP75_23875 [Aquabacterium soli]
MSTPEQTFAIAKLALPSVPDEVFALWLNDRIRQNGWPPEGDEWEGFLFGESLHFWSQLKWSKRRVSLTAEALSLASRRTAMLLYEASVLKQENIMSHYIPNTRERFASVMAYAIEHQALPSTIVLLERNGRFDVIEGNHRVAVLLGLQSVKDHLGVPNIQEVEAWVAKLA